MALRSGANEIVDLIRRLGSRSPARVDRSRTRLVLLGERAVEPLLESLEGAENRIRARAMPLLALIQDSRAREPLAAMLLDRSPKLREIAIHSLSGFPCPETVKALNAAFRREKRVALRAAAIESLVELFAAGEETAVRQPLHALTDPSQPAQVRTAALRLLLEISRSQRESLLKKLMGDPDPAVRKAAVHWVAPWEPGSTTGARPVETELLDQIERLSAEDFAGWDGAVRHLVAGGSSVVRPLVDEMRRRSHDPEFCKRAGIVFKSMGPRRGRKLPELLEQLTEPLPLQVVIDVLGAWGVKSMIYRLKDLIDRIDASPRAADSFCGVSPMNRVRAMAHLELAGIGSRLAIRDLRKALADPDRRLEWEVPAALESIGKRDELGPLLLAYGREDEAIRARIGSAVRAIMRREQIRRNSRIFNSLDRAQKRALAAILPPASSAVAPRSTSKAKQDRKAARRG